MFLDRKILNHENTTELHQIKFSNPDSENSFDSSVSDKVTLIFQWFFSGGMCLGIALFGISTNIINVLCFIFQGFKDPINISFVALAISDIGCLLTHFWTSLCYTPAFAEADLPFDSTELQYLTSAIPHTGFLRVTSWITALITLERCLCIIAPLKVKQIITHKKIIIIIVFLFVVLTFSTAPVYFVLSLGYKFYPERNKTLIGLHFTKDREIVESLSYIFNNAVIQGSSFLVIITSTGVLVVQLHKKTKWRNLSVSGDQSTTVTSKNQKVAKMVLFISGLFIACFIPISIFCIAMALEPGLSNNGQYEGYFTIFGGFVMMLEAMNSSGNIFIYYHMSSKFKETVHTCIFKSCFKHNP